MSKSIMFLMVIAMIGSGCTSGSPLNQAGTMVAQTVIAAPSTATPTTTYTPKPIESSTPMITSTPLIALTNSVESFKILSELDVYIGSNSDIHYTEGHLVWKQIEPITIKMTGPQKDAGIAEQIDKNIKLANFIFKSDVTWNASGILICGIIFRSEEDIEKGEQYQFYFYRLSGLPAYLIDVYDFGRYKYTVSDTKFSDTLNFENGRNNQFVLVAQDNVFNVYINGKHQGQFFDESQKRRSEGALGFLGWQESGDGSCIFENSWIWALE